MTSLFKHTSVYAIGNSLTTIASLVSFPILTRLLSVADYGFMSTVTLTLSLLVAIGKLGMQRAAVRFYHESRRNPGSESTFTSTLILGMLGVGVLTTLIWAGSVAVLPASWIGADRLKFLLLLTAGLILIRVADSGFTNLLYAEERSTFVSGYGVVKRYLTLVLVVLAMFLLARSVTMVFAATIAAEMIVLAWIAYTVLKSNTIRPDLFSRELFSRIVAFGVPMVGAEMAWSLLAAGDRYVIQHLMGADAVGIYSASYNLCEHIKGSTMDALTTAVAPMYMRIWDREGRGATESFLGRYARTYLALAFLVSAVTTANAESLVTILASAKYVHGTVIVPWVMVGMALESYVSIAAAGLLLKKRTSSMFWLVAAAAAINIALNYLLIPIFGLSGAAIATLLAFGALLASTLAVGRSELAIPFPVTTLLVTGVAFCVSCFVSSRVTTGSPWLDLFVNSAIVVVIYCAIAYGADRGLRESVREMIPVVRAKIAQMRSA
jgi:O-antigen/teichoic acid export membrane protein